MKRSRGFGLVTTKRNGHRRRYKEKRKEAFHELCRLQNVKFTKAIKRRAFTVKRNAGIPDLTLDVFGKTHQANRRFHVMIEEPPSI